MPSDQPEPINVVYVAGYGRSGSTLLDRLLGSHPEITGLGEIAYLVDGELADFYWERAADSDFWNNLRETLQFEPDERQRRERVQKHAERQRTGWLWQRPSVRDEYNEHIRSTLEPLQQAAGTRYIVDSSKTARERFFRPHRLRRVPGVNLKVVHLVRDPRGCTCSVLKGSNAAMEQGRPARYRGAVLRSVYGWITANLSGVLYQWLGGRNSYQRIRYEELVEQPEVALARLEEFLDVDFSDTLRRLREQEPVSCGPQFAGNRMRNQDIVRLKRDDQWRTALSRPAQWFVYALCSPIAVLCCRKQSTNGLESISPAASPKAGRAAA